MIGLLAGVTIHYLTNPRDSAAAFNSHPNSGQHAGTTDSRSDPPLTFHEAVIQASPAVVSIYTETVDSYQAGVDDPLFRNLFGDGGQLPINRVNTNQGSGVIISQDGFIITNEHLVKDVDRISVILSDGRQFDANKVGADQITDLAVLKIQGEGMLPQIRLASENTPRVGDIVLAIGNPYGVGQTVTMGIVSATGRRNVTDTVLQDFIQIDAAINPGNSGGPLVNSYGELVGINTAIYAPENGAQGIGFAVPLRLVNYVVPQIIDQQKVERGWLGLQVDDLLYYPELYSLYKSGVVVTGVFENSPADKAHLHKGDIITHVNQQAMVNAHRLLLETTTSHPGTRIHIRGRRQNKPFEVSAILSKRPQ